MANNQVQPAPRLVNQHGAAHHLSVAVPTLRKWRVHGGGPIFLKLGRAVRYDVADLDAWVDACRRTSTSSPLQVRS